MTGYRVHLLSDLATARGSDDLGGIIQWATRARSIMEANRAIQAAADANANLLIILGEQRLSDDALGMLLEAFRIDAHFGVSTPRVSDVDSGELFKLREDLGDSALRSLSRRVLTRTAEYYILPEFLTSCFVVRNELVANLGSLDEGYETLAGSLQEYLCLIRRAGFRTVVVNQAEATVGSGITGRSPLVSRADTRKLLLRYPDAGRAQTSIAQDPLHLHETLLGRLYSPDPHLRKSMLLDLRGIPSYTNGTVEAVLAVCDALHAAKTDWRISVLAVSAAADYHKLNDRYRSWTILTREGGGQFYTVALRLSQPWTFGTLLELHSIALVNLYSVLDTIAWDILFEAPAALSAVWTFMGEYADGLIYNSFHTRGNFQRRFPVAREQADFVFHHSFDPLDYADPALRSSRDDGDYIFIVGNAYDHKHLRPTVDLLSSAFPFQKLKVLGLAEHPSENVEALKSGNFPAEEIDRLFAEARLVIFPSLYEGFGFPTLKGLSYGRSVIARRSELLTEIAANYSGPGRLFAYSHPIELVEIVGQLVHGCAPDPIPLSSNPRPKNWSDIACGILDFIERHLASAGGSHWAKRDRAIRQLEAFCE